MSNTTKPSIASKHVHSRHYATEVERKIAERKELTQPLSHKKQKNKRNVPEVSRTRFPPPPGIDPGSAE